MDLSKLKSAEQSEKLELYEGIIKSICDLQRKENTEMSESDLELLVKEISQDLLSDSPPFVESLLKHLKPLLESNESTKCFLSKEQKSVILKSLVNVLIKTQDDQLLLCCIEHLMVLLAVKLDDDAVMELFNRLSEVISKKSVSATLYIAVCTFIQNWFCEYKDKLPDIMLIAPKLIFPPLGHSSVKIREVAEKTLDDFPKLLLYSENPAVSNVLLKLVKDTNCKDLEALFKDKQEIYVLKVWKHIVNTLGKSLHANLRPMQSLFQLIEKAFKSPSDEICKAAFLSWKYLISNFALEDAALNDSKKLRFLLKPFKNLSKFNEGISLAVCDTWWHLAWSLSHNLSTRFTEVCLPLLEFTIGKTLPGTIEKAVPKATQILLARRGCHFLLRLLEQPPNAVFSRISSPKKLPSIVYPSLQVHLEPKVIIRHSKEIMAMIRNIIETFGNSKDMTSHVESLLKSMLFIISTVIEERNKECTEAVISFINLVSEITESRKCPPLTCLKCIDSLSKLPKSILVSHCFNCGPRKPQDILCTTLLKLLLNHYLLDMEIPNKKFLMAYNRLIQAGLCESLNPLLMTQKYIHIVKSAILLENSGSEILYEIWSGIASPLLESIEKTQEVNQGDKTDHDFSCCYDVLLCPFEHNFPVPVQQLRTKPAFRLWTNLYKSFIRSSSLVTTVSPNEVCEQFCTRLKNYFIEDLLKEPQHFDVLCFILEVVIDSVDFTSVGSTSSQGFQTGSLLVKKKKPLGNVTSLVDLLTLTLNIFYSTYINEDEDMYHSCTPKAQKKGHISKTGVPFDLIKLFISNLKSGSSLVCVLGEIVAPLSRFFTVNQQKYNNAMGQKLEELWNTVTSSVEMYYLGPYDTDFLATMNPMLEYCIGHSRRLIKERSRRFWFATFASSCALKMPESFKAVLKKSKLSLAPEDNISSIEEISYTQDSTSLENGTVNFENAFNFKEPFLKPFASISPKEVKPSVAKAVKSNNTPAKSNSTSTKKSVDELPSSEFVKIDSPGPSSLTPRRRSIRHRKSFVPALYNDLSQSQDTATFGGSSESFDSSSCEILEFQSQEDFTANMPTATKQICIPDEQIGGQITSEKNGEEQQIECCMANKITSEKEIEEIITNNVIHIAQDNDVNDKNMDYTSHEENLVSDAKSLPDLHCLNEADIKDSIEDIMSSVSDNASGSDKSYPTQLKKRNANEHVQNKNEKKIILSNNPPEHIKTQDITTISDIEINDIYDLDSDTQIIYEKIVKTSANSTEKISKQPHAKVFKKMSESFAFKTGNNVYEKADVLKPNQTCPEIIDLSDSEEIIPSSQSSGESVNFKKIEIAKPVAKKSSRRSLKFDTFEGKTGTSGTFTSITAKNTPNFNSLPQETIPVEKEKDEKAVCSETCKNISESLQKESIKVISKDEECSSAIKEAVSMPLKSSENLLGDELINVDVKSVLATVLQMSEKNRINIVENTPPSCETICALQNVDHINFQSDVNIQEASDKMAISNPSDLESKLQEIKTMSNCTLKEESPKTVRAKSLRSAGKNTRKSMDSVVAKKTIKRNKRKSMSCVAEAKKTKCNALDSISESFPKIKDPMFEMMEVDNHSDSPPSSYSDSIADSQEKNICTTSQTNANMESSLLLDLKNVISDIQEKLESYEESDEINLCYDEEKTDKIDDNFNLAPDNESKGKNDTKDIKLDTVEMPGIFSEISAQSMKTGSETKENIEILSTDEEMKLKIPVNDLLVKTNNIVSKAYPLIEFENLSSGKEHSAYENKFLNSSLKDMACNENKISHIKDEPTCNDSIHEGKTNSEIVINASNLNHELIEKRKFKPETEGNKDIILVETELLEVKEILQKDNQFEVNDSASQEIAKDIQSNLENVLEQNSEDISSSNDKYGDQTNRLEHNILEIAAYEEIGVNSNIIEEETSKNLESDSEDIIDVVNIDKIKNGNMLNKEVVKFDSNVCSAIVKDQVQNSQDIKENGECVCDDPNDLLLLSSESDFTENIIEISNINHSCATVADVINSSEPLSLGDNLHDKINVEDTNLDLVDEIQETPCLLTSETLETDSDNKPDDQTSFGENSECFIMRSCSGKRKAKVPVRSPFALRQRSNILVSKNFSINSEPNTFQLKICTSPSKRAIEGSPAKLLGNEMKKQKTASEISSIVENAGLTIEACRRKIAARKDMKKASEAAKPTKMVNYDEMTNLNTRLNASMTLQTRRYKMIAASQRTGLSEESHSFCEDRNGDLEDNFTKTTGILKRRKSMSDLPSSKIRKVTFAEPLYEERTFRNNDALGTAGSMKSDFLIITKEQLNNFSEETEKICKAEPSLGSVTEETSSVDSESHNSENQADDYSNLPVSPLLINCEDSVSSILKGLTSPTWVRGLEALLLSKNIKTIGDLCKLNVHELKALPFKSPKVICLHNALVAHLTNSQQNVLEKLKSDDGCSSLSQNKASTSDSKTYVKDNDQCKKEVGENEPEFVQALAEELLSNDNLQKLSTESLVLLAKRCFAEVTDRLQTSSK